MVSALEEALSKRLSSAALAKFREALLKALPSASLAKGDKLYFQCKGGVMSIGVGYVCRHRLHSPFAAPHPSRKTTAPDPSTVACQLPALRMRFAPACPQLALGGREHQGQGRVPRLLRRLLRQEPGEPCGERRSGGRLRAPRLLPMSSALSFYQLLNFPSLYIKPFGREALFSACALAVAP